MLYGHHGAPRLSGRMRVRRVKTVSSHLKLQNNYDAE